MTSALVEGFLIVSDSTSRRFQRERYIAVASPKEAKRRAFDRRPRTDEAGRAAASVRDLLGERLILREAGSGTREILEKHLAARDLAVTDFAGIVEIEHPHH